MFTVVRTIHRCSYLVGCRTYRAELGLLHSAMVDKNAVRLPRLYGHTAAAQQEIDEIISDRKHLIVKFSNEKSASFNSLWLRHHCQCTECVQPHSGQKLVNPLTFPINLTLKDSAVKGKFSRPSDDEGDYIVVDGLVTLKWNEDDHVAQIPLEYLLENQYSPEARKTQDDIRDVSYLMGPDVPTVECDEVMNSQEGLLSWLVALNEFGAAVVKKCPKKKGFLDKIVPRITNIMPTIYGHNFVVEDTDRPVNVAYSNIRLDLHMDLIYYESAPGLQFLHCIKFNEDVQGGESELLDSFLVADEMRKNFPQHFRALCEIPATFQKIHYERDNPVSMRYRKPHFEANEFDKIIQVNWAPPFEGPLMVPEDDIQRYYEAYNCFAKLLEESPHRVVFRLGPGDLLSFNNRRVLHGRKGFVVKGGGSRQLEGCYANIDEFKSRVNVISKLHGKGHTAKRVGNNDLL